MADLVSLVEVVVSQTLQVRTRTDPKVVDEYRRAMRAGAVFPAIKVARIDGALLLVDGFHRVAALKALHIDHCEAEVLPVSTLEEARWEAARANLTHGVRLKHGERRAVFSSYIHAGRHRHGARKRGRLKSYREMAADLPGFAHSSLRNWAKQDFPALYRSLAGGEEKGLSPGGLPDGASAQVMLLAEAQDGLERAAAAAPGITDARARGELLEQVEALRSALMAAGVDLTPL